MWQSQWLIFFLNIGKQKNPIFGNKGDTALLIVAAKPPRCVRIA